MDNRHGPITDAALSQSVSSTEAEQAVEMLVRQSRKHFKAQSLAADKGYHSQWFVESLRSRGVRLHASYIEELQCAGLDGRTLNSMACRTS